MSQTSNTNPTQNPQGEPRFSILPYPAKSNNPADLADLAATLASNPAILAHHAREPHIPNQEALDRLAELQPLSREELKKRSEELNK